MEPRFGSGVSGNPDTATAVRQACADAEAALAGEPADLALVFFTAHHAAEARGLRDLVRARLSPRMVMGCSAVSVIGGVSELESVPGVTVLAGVMPGVSLAPFALGDLPGPDAPAEKFAAAMGADHYHHRTTLVFADPFSVPLVKLLPAMDRASPGRVLGGIASGAEKPGGNMLILGDHVASAGLIGLSIAGPISVDAVVSQGCRPIGPNLVVTKAKANLIRELGGRPAVRVVQEVIAGLPEHERELLRGGLLLGCVTNEYKERFGRGDYVIRQVMAADEASGAIAVGELMRVGQTVRLHARDAATAREDLAMLLDAEKLRDRPGGALLITCNGRGKSLFGEAHQDAKAVARAFAPAEGGEELARAGRPIDAAAPSVPTAGFFAAGEIGPVAGRSYLHGHTACLALFRAKRGR